MAITSRIFSTTQIVSCLRILLAQIEQISPSDTLKQRWQNFISLRIFAITSPNCATSFSFCLSKCNTSRNAVFLPMPGSLANSFTAFSRSEEQNCIHTKISLTPTLPKGKGTRLHKADVLQPCRQEKVFRFGERAIDPHPLGSRKGLLCQSRCPNWPSRKF